MKKTIANWLARRAEYTARRIRRDLRDHTRRELVAAACADIRARGLRLYAAWGSKDPTPVPTRHVARGLSALIPHSAFRISEAL